MKRALGLALLIAAFGGGCAATPDIGLPAPEVRDGVRVDTDGLYRWQYGSGPVVGISGTAVNETGHDLRMCLIYLDVLNGRGEKVADAMATTTGLRSGATWRFQAMFTNPFSTSFQRIELNRVQAR